MKIFGTGEDGDEYQELYEVGFQAHPNNLRKLAKFLEEMACSLENDPKNFGHGHAKDFCENWNEENPDIIVFKPNT